MDTKQQQLAWTQERVGDHMQAIVAHFKPGVKITVLVRTPGFPERDFLMTDDKIGDVAEALQRREKAGPTSAPEIEGAAV